LKQKESSWSQIGYSYKKIESELKRDNIKLMNSCQSIISEQEKNKLLLLKLEVYEKRKDIIKNNPDITEAMLDELMPLS
jgi:ASC-1-like (ASCH) protein